MQIWIHDNKMKKIVALNNDIPDMMSYTNSSWHSYLDQATSTFDFTIPKFSNGELHEDLKLINDECFVSFYVNGSYQVFYIATLQEDDFNIQLTCNNTNLEYALEYANPFSSESAQTIEWYLNHMDLLSFAAVEIGINEISDRKRTLAFDSQETKMNRLQSLMSKFEAEFEFKVELNRDGTYKRIVINIYQEADDTHHGIGSDRKDVVLYYSNGLKGVQVSSDKTQMFNAGVFTGKDGLSLNDVEISEKNADGIEEFYSRKGNPCLYAPIAMNRYPATMRPDGQDNWIRKDFQTEYENVNDLKAYALRTLKKYAYPLVTYTASVQSGFVSHYTDLKLGDTIRIIDNNFVGGLALEARVSEMIISFDNPANNSFVFTNYRKLDNKPSSALQTRIEQAVESKLPYRIELATTGGVTFKNNEGETIVKPSLYKGNLPYTKDVSWHWALGGVATIGTQYRIQAKDITDSEVLTVSAYVGNTEVATTEITLTNVDDGVGVESIDRHFTSSDQSDGVTIEGAEWSDKPPAPTEDGKYLWAYDKITYTDGTVTTTKPAAVGANFDVDAFRAEIAEDLKDVPNREEFENKISEEIATSKAEIETQIETAKTQAESNAKEYADTINQETNKVAELANAAAGEIKADLVNVKNNLTSTSLVANNAQAAVDAAKQDLANVTSELNTAKQDLTDSVTAVNTKVDNAKAEITQAKQQLTNVANDLSQAKTDLQNAVSAVDTKATNLKSDLSQAKKDLTSQAQQLQTQANAQSELTKRVSSVEKTADGTKTTVSELSKTVAQNGKDITSVTARTKTVEDDLAGTKTTLSQVKTTADSTSQKTATLETGLNGLSAKFDNLSVGGVNLIKQSTAKTGVRLSADGRELQDSNHALSDWIKIEPNTTYTLTTYENVDEGGMYYSLAWYNSNANDYSGWISRPTGTATAAALKGGRQYTSPANATYAKVSYPIKYPKVKLERGNISTDYNPNGADLEQKVAEYKQNADQNYASLQTTVQNLDGTVQHNKTVADQTAQGFTTRIESLETYKDGESERANAYFESAKTETAKQLTAERTAIAKDYVAKSTYTSDVTGIRNDLTATTTTANTTKTNLANYQASNDKMVASLKSSLQTTDGNVSNLQTKVEAVPGQITSAVSAVEGKIPTNVSTRNLILKSNDFANPHKQAGANTEVTSTNDYFIIKSTGYTANDWGGISWNMSISEVKAGEEFSILMPVYIDSSVNLDNGWSINIKNHRSNSVAYDYNIPINKKDQWFNVAITFKSSKDVVFDTYPFYVRLVKNGLVRIKPPMLVRGNLIPSDYQPAFEDTESDITKLSSELTQTKDGITLLATKTELNTAKNELQSGITTATNKANSAQNTANNNAQTISTHTTQISALNTGLQAKVSQSEFNTLSGRVTTAENNITAKANELSSKITSVEGKIPTNVSTRNLILKSNDFANPHKQSGDNTEVTSTDNYFVLKSTGYTADAWGGISWNMSISEVKAGEQFSILMPVYIDSSVSLDNGWGFSIKNHKLNAAAYYFDIPTNKKDQWFNVAITFKAFNDVVFSAYPFYVYLNRNGLVRIKPPMLVRGNLMPSDYQPAFEDTELDVTKLNTTLTQTADGLRQLSTQVTSQGSTITSHTNSINSLTTGLQAKVSQSEFNTLSGRVTTAENNITAKANELTSKITSVEGKIPTSVGGRNLLSKTNQGKTNWSWEISSGGATIEDFDTYGVNAVKMTRKSDAPVSWSYIQYSGLIRKLIEPDTKYTLSFDVYPTQDVTFTATLMRGDAVGEYTDWAAMNTALANRWTKVSCVLTSKTTLPDDLSQVVYLQGMPTANWNWLVIKNIKLEEGVVSSDWSPAPEDYDSKLSTVQSEFKQTTDAIKASVSSLDNSTVKNSSLTINADGIVMKAGKSTTDVANAIGSYFAVNQNAINLFSDKINVKGNMIVSGAITSDKIASKQINTAHLNGKIITADTIATNAITADAIKAGAVTTDKMSANSINGDRIAAGTLDAAKIKAGSITASQIASGTITSAQIKTGTISAANIAAGTITGDNIKANSVDVSKIVGIDANYIKAKIEYAMIDWLKGKTITAYNDNMTIDLQNGRISFKDGSNAVYRQTPDGIHTGFLHFEAGSLGGIYAAFGATSTRQGINSKSSEFAGIRCYRVSKDGDSHDAKIDKIEVIGDTVQFGHGYRSDGSIGGGFIMDNAAFGNETPYSMNRVIKSIEALWRILHDHAKNTGYRFDDSAFINALNNEYNAWHDMHND